MRRRVAATFPLRLVVGLVFALGVLPAARAADFYWSGDSATSDNIDQSGNWFSGTTPACGDNLYFNNTGGGGNNRLWPYNNYGCSYFANLILYDGGNAIKWRGNKTYLYKFENNNEADLFEAEADLSNRTGPDTDLEINPVGSGGVTVGNVDMQNGMQLKVYGGNTLTINGVVSQSGSGNATMALLGSGVNVVMTAQSTYAGSTYIAAGTLDLRNTTDTLDSDVIYLGDTSGSNSGTLTLGADGVDLDNPVNVRSGSSGTKTISYTPTSGAGSLSNGVTMNAALTITVASGGTLKFLAPPTTNFNLLASRLTVAGAGTTLITNFITNTSTSADILKQGTGRLVLNASNYIQKGCFIDEGTVVLGNGQAIGTNDINLGKVDSSALNATLYATGGVTVVNPINVRGPNTGTMTIGQEDTGANNAFSGRICLTNGSVTVTAPASRTLTLSGVISATGSLVKSGAGKVVLSAENTYSGATRVNQGELQYDGTNTASPVTVHNATLSGRGRVGALNLRGGSVLHPGLSPGTLTAGATSWDTNGLYTWEINNFAGTVGADPGWDLLAVNGTLTIDATSANTFTVKVYSLRTDNALGIASNFNQTAAYTQIVAHATSISGFATNKFTVDVSTFSNTYNGRWTIAQVDSTNVAMVYTPDDDTNPPLVGISISTNAQNRIVDGGVVTNAFLGTGGARWWVNNEVGIHDWADRDFPADFGIAWQAWANGNWGFFGQDVPVNPSNGNVFVFTMFANTENCFSSTVQEAYMKLEFYNDAGVELFESSRDIYNTLVSNRNTWIPMTIGATNTYSGVSTMKVVIGFGNADISGGCGNYAVKWDHASLVQGHHLQFFIGSTNVTTNTDGRLTAHTTVTDGQLAQVSNDSPLRVVFSGYDVGSGLSRGTTTFTTQMNIDVGTWLTDNVTNYTATNSSADASTLADGATNTWLFQNVDLAALVFKTNAIQASLKDADFDWPNDQATLTNQVYGYLVVNDDDVDVPLVGSGVATNLLLNNSVELGDGATVISNWVRVDGSEYREGDQAFGYTGGAFPQGTNALKAFGGTADLMQTNITVIPGAFYHAYGQFYHSSTEDQISGGAGSTRMFIHLEWLDASGVTISNDYSGSHNATTAADSWQFINLWVTAPANAAKLNYHIETDCDTCTGSVFGDDFHLTREARVMAVWIGATNVSARNDGGTNAIHYLTDGQVAGVSAANRMKLVIGAYDATSGLSRGTTDAGTQMNLDFQNWLTDNVTNYVATNSSDFAGTFVSDGTSVWAFSAVDLAAIMDKTNRITVSLKDADLDRTSDQATATNEQYGYIAVNDDDSTAPVLSGFSGVGSVPAVGGSTTLTAGDVAIIGFNSDNPDTFTFVALAPIAPETVIHFSDNGWFAAGGFRPGEGSLLWSNTAPLGIAAGTMVTFTNFNAANLGVSTGSVVKVGSPSLAAPDQMLAYQSTSSSTTFLFGVNWNGGVWQADATDSGSSALPTGLTNAMNALALTSAGSNVYNMAMTAGTKIGLLTAIANTANWVRVPTVTLPPAGTFNVQSAQITDGHIFNGGWSITGLVQDTGSGVNSNTAVTGNDIGANYDLWNPSGVITYTNTLFAIHPVDGGGLSAATSLAATVSAIPVSENVLGLWTVRVSVADNDEDRADDRRILTNSDVLVMDVIDDDTNFALVGSAAVGGPMTVWKGTNYRGFIGGSVDTTTNATYTITDGSLVNIATNNLTTDPSMESAGTWSKYDNVDIVNWAPDTGVSNGLLVGWVTNGFGGFYQQGITGAPGMTYRMTARLRKESSFDPTNVYLRIEWYQGNDATRAGTDGGVVNIGTQLTTAYQTFTTYATAPTGTVYVRPVVNFDGTNQVDTGANESAFVDNIMLFPVDLRLVFSAYDIDSGLQRANAGSFWTNMNIDVGSVVADNVTNYVAGLSSADSMVSTATSTWSWVSPFDAAQIQTLYAANSNAVRASLEDADFDRGTNDQMTLTNWLYGYLKVIDDDTSPPAFMSSLRGSNVAMDFLIGPSSAVTSYYQSGTGTGGVFRVTDADLIQVSAANPMRFAFAVVDPESGVGRANGGTDPTNLNYDIGSHAWGQNLFTTYSNVLSSPDAFSVGSTSVYYHTTPFTYGAYFNAGSGETRTGELQQLISAATNRITVSADNMDSDRGYANDHEEIIDKEAGQLVVVDDDAEGPTNWLFYVGTSYSGSSNTASITDGDLAGGAIDFAYIWTDPSGVLVTNVGSVANNIGSLDGNVMPNFDFVQPNTITQTADFVHTGIYPKVNGATIVTVVEYNVTQITYTNNYTGTWYISASAQDLDSDWPLVTNSGNNNIVSPDRTVRTNLQMAFFVGDDDTGFPTLSSNANARPLGVWIGSTNYAGSTVTTNATFDLTDGQLAGVGGLNMVRNAGFERGFTDYDLFGSGYSNSQLAAEYGTNGISFAGAAGIGCCQGFFQNVAVDASVATSYIFTVRVRRQPNNIVTNVELKLEFFDVGFVNLGGTYYTNIASGITTNWKTFELTGTNPPSTTYVRPVFLQWGSGSLAGNNQEMYVDSWNVKTNLLNPLKLVFSAYDTNSGIHRLLGGGVATTMHISVGNQVSNNVNNYLAAESSVPSTALDSTNVWAFSTINQGQLQAMIAAGSNAVYASMTDADFDRPDDWLGSSNRLYGYLRFADDDDADPLIRTNPLEVMSGGVMVPAWTNRGSTNVVWRVSDGQFYSAATTNPLAFSFRVSDSSGIKRHTVGSDSNMNVSIAMVTTNNTTNYAAPVISSADTTDENATSVWRWVTQFSQDAVSNMYGGGTVGLTNIVRATVYDADNDRESDDRSLIDKQYGYVWLYDDDTNSPAVANLLGANLLSNSGFEVAGWWSGIADGWDATNYPVDTPGATFGNYYRSDFRSHGGGFSASIPGQWGTNAFTAGGWYQDATNTYGDGVTWRASAWAMSDGSWSASYCAVSIEFYALRTDARLFAVTNTFPVPSNGWVYTVVEGTNPPGTAWARIVLTADGMATNFGSIYFDDAVLFVATNALLPMDVRINDISYYREGIGTTGSFQVTDQDLAGVTPTSTLKFIYRVYDPTSGVGRSKTEEKLNYDLGSTGSPFLTNIYNTYSSSLSSVDSTLNNATSVFAHVTNFTVGGDHSGTNFAETGDVFRLLRAVTNLVTVSAPNADEDRGITDTEWFTDSPFGFFVVQDEDTNGPVASLRYIGTNYSAGTVQSNVITDQEMVGGGLDFAYEWVDASGLFITNENAHQTNDSNYGNLAPNWELVDPSNSAVQYGANTIHPAANLFSPSGNGSLYATAVQQNVSLVVYTNNQIGTWTIQVSAQDEDNDRGSLSYNNTTVKWDRGIRADMPVRFSVIDDDEGYPTVETQNYSLAVAFVAYANGGPFGSGAGNGTQSNRIYTVTDEEMIGFATNPLRIVFNIWDAYSGVARGSNTATTNANITVANWITNNVTNFNLSGSTSYTTNMISTSQWTHSHAFPLAQVNAMLDTTSRVSINVPDADGDRVGDILWRTNHEVGFIRWQDDGNVPPQLRSFSTTNAALQLYLGGNPGLGFAGTNTWLKLADTNIVNDDQLFLVNDGHLARVSVAAPFDLNIWVYETENGVARDAAGGALSNSSLSVGSVVISNVAGYVASNSSSLAQSKLSFSSTSLWRFTSFTYDQVSGLYTSPGSSNRLTLHAFNADMDRGQIDQERSDTNLGWLVVSDDDSNYVAAANLALGGRLVTNTTTFYDHELNVGFQVRLRFWDDVSGLYTAAANGAFSPPTFDILNPNSDLVQTNQTFVLTPETQVVLANPSFETVGTNAALADAWDPHCYNAPALWFRSNGVGRVGDYALAADYTSAVTNQFGETIAQWVNVSNMAVGETFIFGGWVKVSNSLPGIGRTLVKFEWWDTLTSNACPAGALQGYSIGNWVTGTANAWVQSEVAGTKPNSNSIWVKAIIEATFGDAIVTNLKAYWDDMYVGSPSNILAIRNGVTVPYSNILLGDYTFRWSGQDSDNDRTNDTLGRVDGTNMAYAGHIFTVADDHPGSPTGSDLYCNGYDKEWTNGVVRDQQIRNGQWFMSFRIIDPQGVSTSGIGDEWAPNYSMLNAAGVTVHQNFAFSTLNASDTDTNVVGFRTMSGILYNDVDTGLYSIVFSAQNQDNDRPGDRGAVTNFAGMALGDGAHGAGHQFLVVDDDTNGPVAPTNVAVDVIWWTNRNLFNVTFNASTDDYSGVYQYRYDTNIVESTSVSNGEIITATATTELSLLAFSNRDFEVGSLGEEVPNYDAADRSINLHGWNDFSADNATVQFWNVSQNGTGATRHVVAEGDNSGNSPRYTLLGQEVYVENSNGYPIQASMSAWFSGDVSRVGNGVTGAAFMKMEFFDASTAIIYSVDNEYGNDHNGNPLFGVNCTGWSNVMITTSNGPANTRLIRFMVGIGQHFTDLPYTGYWDNVVVTVQVVGAVGNSYSFPMTNALEGIRTNWLFAVDDDNDRPNDRFKGRNTNYITMLDLTPPLTVTNFNGTNGLDESSEVSLTWNPLPDGGSRAGDNEMLSPWRTYYVYYTTNANVTTNDPSVSFTNAGYGALHTNTATAISITNLEFDSTYRFVIRGQDRVGNLGPSSRTVEVTTLSFVVTQGLVNASSNINVSWLASPGKVYDVLWEDGVGYTDSFSNLWTRMAGRVTNSWLVDSGDTNRAAPKDMVNTLRFYRVSREGQWATNASPRRASREIYVSKTWQLRPGENWISLPFLPDTNRYTVKDIFGTNLLPRSFISTLSTKISWYGHTLAGTNSGGVATNEIWLSSGNRWLYSIPAASNGLPADNWPVPTNEAFNIEIPLTSSTQTFVSVGRLPTNIMTMSIYGANGETNYSVLSWGTPYRVTVKELGLVGASFSGGVNVTRSDEIRILNNNAGAGSLSVPKARIWRNGTTNFFLSPSGVSANDYVIEPGEAIIIVRKRGPSMTWTNRLYYSPPGKNINP